MPLSINQFLMSIFGSLGFLTFLLVLSAMLPNVFAELSRTLTTVLQSSAQAFTAAGVLASYAGHLPPPH